MTESEREEGEITPEEVAATVVKVHSLLDDLKEWSVDTVDWIEHEREYYASTEAEEVELDELMAFVNTVYRRLTESEERSLIPLTELR